MARANNLRLKFSPVLQPCIAGVDPGSNNVSTAIDDPSEYLAWIFQMPETDLVTHVGLRFYSSTNAPTYRVSLRSVGDDGVPLDTIITSASFTPENSWGGTFQWIELASPYLASRGQLISIVVSYLSGSIGPSNNSSISVNSSNAANHRFGLPYAIRYSGTVNKTFNHPVWALKSETRAYGIPLKSLVTYTLNSPEQAGLRFRFEPGFGSSFSLKGIVTELSGAASGSGKSFDLVLYDATSELDRVTFLCDIVQDATDACILQIFFGASPPTLSFGKEYFIAIAPNEADTACKLLGLSVENATDMTAWPGSSSFYSVERAISTDPWTRLKTERPRIDLIIDDWTSG